MSPQRSSTSQTSSATAVTETRRSVGPPPSSVGRSSAPPSAGPASRWGTGWAPFALAQVAAVSEGRPLGVIAKFKFTRGLCVLFCSGNTFSLVDCIPLLRKTLKDESSVTCKLACTAVRVSAVALPWHVGSLPVSTVKTACVQTCNAAHTNKRRYPPLCFRNKPLPMNLRFNGLFQKL